MAEAHSTGLLFKEADIKDPPNTITFMNIINIYSTSLLFRNVDIDDPPDISIHKHYQHSRGFLFREGDISIPSDCSVHEHYQGERFQKIKKVASNRVEQIIK
jgi:hypothetical protein